MVVGERRRGAENGLTAPFAVDIQNGYVVLEDGTRCPVMGWFTEDGEDTTPDEAVHALYNHVGLWVSIDIHDWNEPDILN